ncbi:MAG: hypothetical protein K6A65_07725, partial [Succinivibrionaceae bacterium]|nr:hypothetical protein [Succinivibrionaceae bacterium]
FLQGDLGSGATRLMAPLVRAARGQEPLRLETISRKELPQDAAIILATAEDLMSRPRLLRTVLRRLMDGGLSLVVCGDPASCTELRAASPTLQESVVVDLVAEFPRQGAERLLAGIASATPGLAPLSAAALELLTFYLCRINGDRRWVALPWPLLMAILGEASDRAGGGTVSAATMRRVLVERDYREGFLAVAEKRDYLDEQILVSTEGEDIGQINGLSVIETPGTSYVFGSPVRITATLRAGGDGDVTDIERKAELAGQIHAKAMMIINGFLTSTFGQEVPLPVSASLVFEQSYSEVDGDSASLTGLCAILSCMAQLPIRQRLAVTGALDQFGTVQPVGGVNEKVEGFFSICALHGWRGGEGVIIPRASIESLVLRPKVVEAVRRRRFHLYAVGDVGEAMELLTGMPWGDMETEDSVCGRIAARLASMGAERPWWHFW